MSRFLADVFRIEASPRTLGRWRSGFAQALVGALETARIESSRRIVVDETPFETSAGRLWWHQVRDGRGRLAHARISATRVADEIRATLLGYLARATPRPNAVEVVHDAGDGYAEALEAASRATGIALTGRLVKGLSPLEGEDRDDRCLERRLEAFFGRVKARDREDPAPAVRDRVARWIFAALYQNVMNETRRGFMPVAGLPPAEPLAVWLRLAERVRAATPR